MTSDDLNDLLEQNRENLKALLDALEADYELADDPEKKAERVSFFGGDADQIKGQDMSEDERIAWLFEQNSKAIAAAAEAAGVSDKHTKTAEISSLKQHSGDVFVPDSEARRAAQKREIRGNRDQ